MRSLEFIDLFAGMGGFHRALRSLGHRCVFASEKDNELKELYVTNYPEMKGKVFGDLTRDDVKAKVPRHDLLCAGFPCQPFSKSGAQLGVRDETRGTLFHEILEILEDKKPEFVLLENVGNFGRHDGGRTWRIVRQRLERLGYQVQGAEHKTPQPKWDWRDIGVLLNKNVLDQPDGEESGDEPRRYGLMSPHHFGYPHHRERFFIVAALDGLPEKPFPDAKKITHKALSSLLQTASELDARDRRETQLSQRQKDCINHWNRLLKALPAHVELPSFPLWGDEIWARYPYEKRTPWATRTGELRRQVDPRLPPGTRKSDLLKRLPSYAREGVPAFRNWKVRYIRQNRDWWKKVRPHLPQGWTKELRQFPPSLRKLEWNAKGEQRNLWRYVLQFRPSGLRVKRFNNCPALVAMTSTQIPILGPKNRFLTRKEGLRLQGFPDSHELPKSRSQAFQALGNAVHVRLVRRLARHLLTEPKSTGTHQARKRQDQELHAVT